MSNWKLESAVSAMTAVVAAGVKRYQTVLPIGAQLGTGSPASLVAPAFNALSWANGVVVVGTIDGTAHALDGDTGVVLWSDKPGADIGGGFSIVDGTLFVGYGYWFLAAPPQPFGGLVAYMLPGAP